GDDQGEPGGRRDGDETAEPRGQAVRVPEEGGRVGPHAEEGAVAEGDDAEATHQRPGAADERPDEDLHRHVDGVVTHPDPREDRPGGERAHGGPADEPRRAHSRRARMPPGRANIITMKITKATTYPISVEISTPPIEMISLMTNEATKAPSMLPRPPSTQTMKVRGPNAAPKKGCTEYWMIRSAPASPAIAPPTAEVT